jgi:hypothetical protein
MDAVTWIQSNLVVVIYGMVGLLILSWLWIWMLARRISRIQKRQKKWVQGQVPANLEDALLTYKDELKQLDEKIHQILAEVEEQKRLTQKNVGPVGIVRFNAFDEMGGDLSFAVAILNGQKNGVVISSIYGREEQRTYAKPIENGSSVYLLSDEEKEAVKQAIQKMES